MERKKITIKKREETPSEQTAPPSPPASEPPLPVEPVQEEVQEEVETVIEHANTPPQRVRKEPIAIPKNYLYIGGGVLLMILLAVLAYIFFFSGPKNNSSEVVDEDNVTTTDTQTSTSSGRVSTSLTEGFPLDDSYSSVIDILGADISIAEWLREQDVPSPDIAGLSRDAAHLGLHKFRAGDQLMYFIPKDKEKKPDFIVYEPFRQPDVFFQLYLRDSLAVGMLKKKVEVRRQAVAGIIRTNLFETILENGFRHDLVTHMEQALRWAVDFHHLKPGDRFRAFYDEQFINGKSKKVVRLVAIELVAEKESNFAFNFKQGDKWIFYDENGAEMRKGFLKSPLRYGRMTSAFNLNRIHPVTGVKRAHLGTDYAAQEGTPILSVADGVIIAQEFKTNNGNYVKVRHDNTYTTQYLHMSRFTEHLRVGSKVKQGEVIGFVGSTGLATGPHVCFRFWKNNKQVDPRGLKLPSKGRNLPSKHISAFQQYRDIMLEQLGQIPYN